MEDGLPVPVIATNEVRFTILGQPAGKRELEVKYRDWHRKIGAFVGPNKVAKAYEKTVKAQAPKLEPLLSGELAIEIRAFFKTELRDLEVERLYDSLQGIVYENDRQLREKHLYHAVDRKNPRVEVVIRPRKQPALF